jgi:hypothetical protein
LTIVSAPRKSNSSQSSGSVPSFRKLLAGIRANFGLDPIKTFGVRRGTPSRRFCSLIGHRRLMKHSFEKTGLLRYGSAAAAYSGSSV